MNFINKINYKKILKKRRIRMDNKYLRVLIDREERVI